MSGLTPLPKMSPERKKIKDELPESLRLPDDPTAEDILDFLKGLFLAWEDLTPEKKAKAISDFNKGTQKLKVKPPDPQS